jgi:hypothetical protein
MAMRANRIQQLLVERWNAGDLGDRSLARNHQPVHSRSGIESEFAWSLILTCRNAKVILAEFFIDHAKALEALGLDAD